MTLGLEGKLQSSSYGNLGMDGASTGATGEEACLVFIFWFLLVPLS
jgi:hypothetical protein